MIKLFFRGTIVGLVVTIVIAAAPDIAETNKEDGILDCFYQENSLACAKKRADAELDRLEMELTGKQGSVSFSKFLEQAGALFVDGTKSLFGNNDENEKDVTDGEDTSDEAESGASEARKFGKRKKKKLLKLIPFIMLLKAKLNLILHVISTHIQIKFFVIAVVSLLVNIARFWIDLKKVHHPAKVIYYEHAQHQHHYDSDQDEHSGYWKRSADASSQDLAYNAYSQQ